MGFGLFYIPTLREGQTAGQVYDDILREARVADELGWHNVWIAEHHFDELGGLVPSPVVLCTAIAMRTTQIRIGAAVAVLPLRNALQVAEDFAMLDVLSGGRVELGVGRGFSSHEFQSMGIPVDSRQERFAEGIAVLHAAWTQDRFSFTGGHYHLIDVEQYPRPLQQPHPPIWVAASTSRPSFELAGRYGFNLMLNPYSRTREELRRGLGWYRDALRGAGHDAGTKRVLVNQHLYVARSEETARRAPREALLEYLSAANRASAKGDHHAGDTPPVPVYGDMYPDKVMFGTPDIVEEKILGWLDLGVTDFCFMSHFGNLDPALSLESVRLFSAEVMPRFTLGGRAARP